MYEVIWLRNGDLSVIYNGASNNSIPVFPNLVDTTDGFREFLVEPLGELLLGHGPLYFC